MASNRDEGPVYYREIQKNAYLKRIPDEIGGSKLRPLGSKKVPLKPMWTQFCIHNGRTPYLEQYPDADSPTTLTHKPIWRACLRSARHVTASVKPHCGEQYDFLVDTDNGAVRMLAPDWESMQDWVTTLRNTLHELKILSRGENVYCMGPAPPPPPPPPRAAARDPTSPLPPTPPTPPDRVPGIELTPTTRPQQETTPRPQETHTEAQPDTEPTTSTSTPEEDVDISNWDTTFSSLPSTSQAKTEPRKSVAKICGQNICLDDSIFKRTSTTDSDEEFFAEIDRICDEEGEEEYKQRVVVSNGHKDGPSESTSNQATNITVIQVSNKEPPHTAIPVLGPETDVFDFEFKQKVTITDPPNPNFVNIVNTEQNDYGTTFAQNDSEYGHLSLTTTVSLTGQSEEYSTVPTQSTFRTTDQNEELYERLCMASTSNSKPSPLPVKRLKNVDKSRKSSLPNLEVGDSTYEYLFLSNNNTNLVNVTTEVNCNGDYSRVQVSSGSSNDPVNRIRSVERSRSQNAYDASTRTRENISRRTQNNSPKIDIKNDNTEQTSSQNKPIWKRGLTELSLLTRLKSIGQNKSKSPTRHEDNHDRSQGVTSPVKVVHRSRPEGRMDNTRRRSSSLSNGQSSGQLTPLRARQAAALVAEQRRGAALAATLPVRDPPVFTDYDNQVWIAWWGGAGVRVNGRAGDRVAALRRRTPRDAAHARHLLHGAHAHTVDILFHRVPLAKIYVINKRDQESLGLKLDSECNIISVEANSACGRAGIPPPGNWALTEINNRPINLLKGGEEDMNRLSKNGTEVSVLIQPSAFVKKLRAALKGNKALLGLR